MAKVSIILPVFNGGQFLGLAIDSVLTQSFEDFELLVADDGSADSSVEIARDFAEMDSRVKVWRNERNLGLFANYNECLNRASGQYIKPFAQDDLLHPHALSRGVEILDNYETVVLVSIKRGLIDSSGEKIKSVEAPSTEQVFPVNSPVSGSKVIQKCLNPLVNYIGEPSTVMFRSSAAGEGFDSAFHHIGDIEYWLRILLLGDYYFLPDEYCQFRCHSGSASMRNSQRLLFGPDLLRIAKKFSWILESCGQSEAEYLEKSILAFSAHVHKLSSAGIIDELELTHGDDFRDLARSLIPEPFDSDDRVKLLIEELAHFRELSYRALCLLGSKTVSAESCAVIDRNARVIRDLEAEVRMLLESPSWRYTRVLREMRKILAVADSSQLTLSKLVMDTNLDVSAQQLEYIDYLRRLSNQVKNSRSWRMSRPLRNFERLLKQNQW